MMAMAEASPLSMAALANQAQALSAQLEAHEAALAGGGGDVPRHLPPSPPRPHYVRSIGPRAAATEEIVAIPVLSGQQQRKGRPLNGRVATSASYSSLFGRSGHASAAASGRASPIRGVKASPAASLRQSPHCGRRAPATSRRSNSVTGRRTSPSLGNVRSSSIAAQTLAGNASSPSLFSFGISSFDDATVDNCLHVDRATRHRPAGIGRRNIASMPLSDVLRAAVMHEAHLVRPSHHEAELAHRNAADAETKDHKAAGFTDAAVKSRASEETLDLLRQLEETAMSDGPVFGDVGDRSQSLQRLPGLTTTVGILLGENREFSRSRSEAPSVEAGGGKPPIAHFAPSPVSHWSPARPHPSPDGSSPERRQQSHPPSSSRLLSHSTASAWRQSHRYASAESALEDISRDPLLHSSSQPILSRDGALVQKSGLPSSLKTDGGAAVMQRRMACCSKALASLSTGGSVSGGLKAVSVHGAETQEPPALSSAPLERSRSGIGVPQRRLARQPSDTTSRITGPGRMWLKAKVHTLRQLSEAGQGEGNVASELYCQAGSDVAPCSLDSMLRGDNEEDDPQVATESNVEKAPTVSATLPEVDSASVAAVRSRMRRTSVHMKGSLDAARYAKVAARAAAMRVAENGDVETASPDSNSAASTPRDGLKLGRSTRRPDTRGVKIVDDSVRAMYLRARTHSLAERQVGGAIVNARWQAFRSMNFQVRPGAGPLDGGTPRTHGVSSVAQMALLSRQRDQDDEAAAETLLALAEIYSSACNEFGQVPVSRILTQLGAPRISLKHYRLGPEGGSALARLLPKVGWRALDLAQNFIGERGGAVLSVGLRHNGHLTELDLSDNRLGPRAGAMVLAALCLPSTSGGRAQPGEISTAPLRTLRFGGNAIGDSSANALRRLVGESSHLRTLNLRDNGLTHPTGTALADGLSTPSCCLTELDLSWNRLGARGVEALAMGAAANRSLRGLDISWNGAGAVGGSAIAAILSRNEQLSTLNASHNGIGTVGAVQIAHELATEYCSLTSLDLSDNPLGVHGVEALLRALGDNKKLRSIGLLNVESTLSEPSTNPSSHSDSLKASASRNVVGATASRTSANPAAILATFDSEHPEGEYILDLSNPSEHWVACKLRDLALENKEPWQDAVYDAGEISVHWSRRANHPWSEVPEVPHSGILRFTYKRAEREVRSVVHYALVLDDPLQREIAIQLWHRAIIEQGENWKREELDGVPLELDEEASVSWTVPESGLLELDYVTYDRAFEAHYRLDLKKADERAIAFKLLERAKADEAGDCFVHPSVDGVPLDAKEMKMFWRPPSHGIFECDYVCTEPQHVCTRHYCLDLSKPDDYELAERLREWAESEPGENLANAQLDGVPFRFLTQKANDIARREARIALSGGSANSAHRVFFPHHGVLQFDYVVVRPRKGLPITAQTYRLDLSKEQDRRVASRLQALSVQYEGDPWLCSLTPPAVSGTVNNEPSQSRPTKIHLSSSTVLPSEGLLEVQTNGALAYVPSIMQETDFQMFLAALKQGRKTDHEREQLFDASLCVHTAYTPEQAAALVQVFESARSRATVVRKLIDAKQVTGAAHDVLLSLLSLADGVRLRSALEMEQANKIKGANAPSHIVDWDRSSGLPMPKVPPPSVPSGTTRNGRFKAHASNVGMSVGTRMTVNRL